MTIELVATERLTFKASTAGTKFIHFEVYLDGVFVGNLFPNGLFSQPKDAPVLAVVEAPKYGWGFTYMGERVNG